MNDALQIPGVANSFTMPIKARMDMLATGIRTQVGVKVLGPDLAMLEKISIDVENVVKSVPGTRSAYAERVTTGYFLDIKPKRAEIARYGLSIDDVQTVIAAALGGMNLTITVEGRERYPVHVRYARELQNDIEKLKRIFVPVSVAASSGSMGAGPSRSGGIAHIPLGEIADIGIVQGPTSIKSEEGLLANYVYVDFSGRDVGGYVEEAKKNVEKQVKLPAGYSLQWSGEYEYLLKTSGAAEDGHSADSLYHFCAYLPQYQVDCKDCDHSSGGPLFSGRLFLASVLAGLQHEHRGLRSA